MELSTEERERFQKGMQDPRLASSLTVWFFPDWPGEEYREWFDLSISLVCSVMPWLFHGPSIEKTLVEVNRIKRRLLPKSQVGSVEELWLRWVRNGAALRHLEELFAGVKQSQLAGDRPGKFVEPGELLWQGSLCISLRRTELRSPVLWRRAFSGNRQRENNSRRLSLSSERLVSERSGRDCNTHRLNAVTCLDLRSVSALSPIHSPTMEWGNMAEVAISYSREP
jgi:hypothetical protein